MRSCGFWGALSDSELAAASRAEMYVQGFWQSHFASVATPQRRLLSACGPTRTTGYVRFRAAVKGITDIKTRPESRPFGGKFPAEFRNSRPHAQKPGRAPVFRDLLFLRPPAPRSMTA